MLRFLLRPNLAMALFGARVLFAFFSPPFVLAHEAHPRAALARTTDQVPFLAANEIAIIKMMAAIEATASQDVDRQFVAMMTPHHQGAVDMAVVAVPPRQEGGATPHDRRGHRGPGTAAMKLAIGEPASLSAPAAEAGERIRLDRIELDELH